MTSYHQAAELDSNATDSVASSPRSDYHVHTSHDLHTRVRFMCSFGGKILPRPHDNQLRYVGGDTRIVAVHRSTTFSTLLTKLSKLSGTTEITVKYQLPNEDLDALISVSTDEDVENMMEEYDRLTQNHNPKSARLRLFLFPKGEDSRSNSISSLLGDSTNRDHWFLDALNGAGAISAGPRLERGRSEASSVVSEIPDYLFGLDNSDDTTTQPRESKVKTRFINQENVSVSDPGSPAPAATSPFGSRSSTHCVPSMPNLPHVKTRPESAAPIVEPKEVQSESTGFAGTVEPTMSLPTGYLGNPMMQYIPVSNYSGHSTYPVPVYYMPGQVPVGNVPVNPVPIRAPYVQQYPTAAGQLPMGYHHPDSGMRQVYGGAMRPTATLDSYDASPRVVPHGMNPQVYYGVRNAAVVSSYPGVVVPTVDEVHGNGTDVKSGRVSQ